jgi:hypothetical protein
MGETVELLLDRLGLWVQMYLVLNQFPRNSWHVSRISCKDVPIFLEEFDKHELRFGSRLLPM